MEAECTQGRAQDSPWRWGSLGPGPSPTTKAPPVPFLPDAFCKTRAGFCRNEEP